MQGLAFVLLFTALTFLSWGAYGPLLRYGTTAMGHDGLKAFVGVGLAYFFIAVVVPFWILRTKGEKGRWTFLGTTYSIVAGSVGAIGALGIILALVFKGNPVYVMPLVFGFAPIVNTLVTAWMGGTLNKISPIFVTGIVAAALGAGGVLYFKPPVKPAAQLAHAAAADQPTEIPSSQPEATPPQATKPEATKPAEAKPAEAKPAEAKPETVAKPEAPKPEAVAQPTVPTTPPAVVAPPAAPVAWAERPAEGVPPAPEPVVTPESQPTPAPDAPAPTAPTEPAPAPTPTELPPAVENPETKEPAAPAPAQPAAEPKPAEPKPAEPKPEEPKPEEPKPAQPELPPAVPNPESDQQARVARTVKLVATRLADEHSTSSDEGETAHKDHTASTSAPNYGMIALSILMAALCWGSYGPMLHQGQMKMGGSRLRPFACVGIAYFIIAVAAPLILLNTNPTISQGAWTGMGLFWSVVAGAAGAIGALGIILAFNSGGKPIYVMPLVFGFAPVINTFISLTEAGTWADVKTMFWISLAVVILGAITVLITAPKAQHGPAPHAAPAR